MTRCRRCTHPAHTGKCTALIEKPAFAMGVKIYAEWEECRCKGGEYKHKRVGHTHGR